MRVLLAEDEKRMAAAIVALLKRMACPPSMQSEAARHRQFEIYHIFSRIKVTYTDVFFAKASFYLCS
mgnify:CR=1 FL=1